jgi:hypothetical protein
MGINRDTLLADLKAHGVGSALMVVEPAADGVGAAYIEDADELVAARRVLQNHPDIDEVTDGPDGMAWTLLFKRRQT